MWEVRVFHVRFKDQMIDDEMETWTSSETSIPILYDGREQKKPDQPQ